MTVQTLSVVVPVYNEVESLDRFVTELMETLQADSMAAYQSKVFLVDDGSTDGSVELERQLQKTWDGQLEVIELSRNFGKSAALRAGFDYSDSELVVTFDADGQDVPAELPRLLAALDEQGVDLMCGWRQTRIDRSVKRRTSKIYNWVTRKGSGLDLHDFNTGLKLLTRELVDALPLYGEFHRYVPVLAYDLGFRVGEIAVEHRPRTAGVSKYMSLSRFPKTFLDLFTVLFLTKFSNSPMYLFGGLGVALGGLGFVILSWLTFVKLVLGEGIGQRPLLMFGMLLTLVGLQLFMTGLLGDALRLSQASSRPTYRVRSSTLKA
ncbi:glycosyltransferase family 2 protein [Stomatohabitans albus]|uniref:glycosyltransferase family 2 protein n=1 Tax=Stomatohabitans albus TaxID=3110766 RepID=UPI00300C1465